MAARPAHTGAPFPMTTPSVPKRYEVRSLLGGGGSGRVYRVQDSIRDRELALKLVTPAESAFLRREFDTLRQIRHENLIQVFDWGALPSGEAYYTMELIEGGDWSRRMGRPQAADEVRHVLTGLLRGLAHLHCHGEIHGDLKPENILLGAGGVVKITDVGMGGSDGRAAGMSGTPGYAAPEVWEGAAADVRSDLYSVGVMAYQALTGKHPFEGRTVREVVSGQLEGWVPSPGVHGVTIPADLERVVMRALERQPGLRQGSADEFMEGFGVLDRIGEILGGKLVGREKEIAEIEKLLYSEETGTPTLLYITGEPGIGKTALMEEVAARLLGAGGRALEIDRARPLANQVSEFLGPLPSEGDANHELQAQLWERSRESPILLYTNSIAERGTQNTYKALARYVWALSMEHGRGSRVMFSMPSGNAIESDDTFEQTIQIMPMSESDCGQLLAMTLGTVKVQPELVSRLHALSGGNAGVLRATLASLIDRELLQRREGIWTFREVTQIHSLGLESGANPWRIAWRHLDPEEKRGVLMIALFRRPVPTDQLQRYSPGWDVDGTFASLLAKGWVRRTREGWAPASDGVRQTVQELAAGASQAEIAAAILRSTPESGDSEERVDLELRYRPSSGVLERGVDSAERAARRGDQHLAVERLRICLGIARGDKLADRARTICLRIAALLRQLGDEDGAAHYLESVEHWGDGDVSSENAAARAHILGQIAMSKGDLQTARIHLTESVEMASKTANRALLLRCHADLAEIDWRHGDEQTRLAAIDRLRDVLSHEDRDSLMRDERAALMYELGAAMVVAGASRDSIDILTSGFQIADSEYWKMRISNALSSANHYLGDSEAQLKWIDEAWSYAESSRSDFFKARILSNRGGMLYHQGRLADAADQDRLSAIWARRVGNTFEFIAGRAGAGICNIHLARYEDALADAHELMSAARVLKDPHYVAKSLELEALANYFLGREDVAEARVREGLSVLKERGNIEVKPRLDWLLARILRKRGELGESRRLLSEAEKRLLETRDPEDLWGVQIEMNLIRSVEGDPRASVTEIQNILRDAEEKGLVIVAIPSALAIAEILHERQMEYGEFKPVLIGGLERAERAGMRELVWQLSHRMGTLAARAGEEKESQSRYTHAVRVLREIAGGLSEPNRKSYLASRHVTSALLEMRST